MIYRFLLCSTVIAICLTMQGCSSFLSMVKTEPYQQEPGERTSGNLLDDEIIEIKALVNIDKAHPDLAQSHIVVTSFNGIVLLAGQVASEDLRQLAAEAVDQLGRARRIHNEITIAGNTSMVARSNDAWISTKIKAKMLANSEIESYRIKVVTENGVVYLMGLVTKEESDRAVELARTTGGVQKVVRIFEYF